MKSKVIVLAIVWIVMASGFSFLSTNQSKEAPITAHALSVTSMVNPTGSTLIWINNGTNTSLMYNYTADGYVTWAFYDNTVFAHINYSITVSTEAYYSFSIWTGLLGSAPRVSKLMMKVNDIIIGNQNFESAQSDSFSTFAGHSQNVTIGEQRLATGSYNLQLVNMINDSIPSENYIAIKITNTINPLPVLSFSFVVTSDLHYDPVNPDIMTVYPNVLLVNHSIYLLKEFVNQTNNMTPQPSFVAVTGDLENSANGQYYPLMKTILDGLDMPYYLAAGNHDSEYQPSQGNYLTSTWGSMYGWTADHLYYYIDTLGYRLIFMDTGPVVNYVSVAQQAWLNSTLWVNKPIFVFLHCPIGGQLWAGVNSSMLSQRAHIRAQLEVHYNVVAVFQGHQHMEWFAVENNILYVETGSIAQYPLTSTKVDVYPGGNLDVNRIQLNDSAMILHSLASGNTTYGINLTDNIQYLHFSRIDLFLHPIWPREISGLLDLLPVFIAIGVVLSPIRWILKTTKTKKTPTTGEAIHQVIIIVIGMSVVGIIALMV